MIYSKFLHPISLDIGLNLLVFGSSHELTQKLVQYPVILDGYPFNKIYMYVFEKSCGFNKLQLGVFT